jgi:predicted ester cyclase
VTDKLDRKAEERHSAVTLRDLDEAWNKGDLSVLDESLHPDCVGHFPSSAEIRGPGAVKQLIADFRHALSELHIEVDDLVAVGDKVVARWRATGVAHPDGATERRVAFTGITIDRFEEGRIIESWSEWDSAGMAAQLWS